MTKALKFWKHYSATDKRIAFTDGKLLSFYASDIHKGQWWDRQDKPSDALEYTVKKDGNTATYHYDEEYTGRNFKEREVLADGTVRIYDPDDERTYTEHLPDGGVREIYAGRVVYDSEDREEHSEDREERWLMPEELELPEQAHEDEEERIAQEWREEQARLWDQMMADLGMAESYEQAMRAAPQPTAEQRLAVVEEEWGKNVDGVVNGTIRQDAHVNVMETPTVFTLIGAQRLPIYMDASKISTVLAQHKGMTPEILKQIPRALADPVAIFTSKTHPNTRVVVMTEIQDTNGATVIVPVELTSGQYGYQINKISSIYGKDSDAWFVDQVTDGRLRYIDRQKSSQWANRTGLQLPAAPTGNGPTIATEADLVKARAGTGHYQLLGEDAARGYTRFEPEIRGEAGDIIQEARTVIGLLKDADASTLPHELGHVFLDQIRKLAQMEGVSPEVIQNWETLRDWLHLRDIDFSKPLSEKDRARYEAKLKEQREKNVDQDPQDERGAQGRACCSGDEA